ncbi:hypothetical protein BTN50_1250 [Candidatus Enterovibrio altilux]|uniref:Uncharacterized protein n=1 Tax=Candidatus Enterovibrio altilux TaxID=1927128 RepID=A0A291B9N4_9GAMM|nr:hypothetical protein BTN50_1250 [Candidatus Enterovibrio luxaltus]
MTVLTRNAIIAKLMEQIHVMFAKKIQTMHQQGLRKPIPVHLSFL